MDAVQKGGGDRVKVKIGKGKGRERREREIQMKKSIQSLLFTFS